MLLYLAEVSWKELKWFESGWIWLRWIELGLDGRIEFGYIGWAKEKAQIDRLLLVELNVQLDRLIRWDGLEWIELAKKKKEKAHPACQIDTVKHLQFPGVRVAWTTSSWPPSASSTWSSTWSCAPSTLWHLGRRDSSGRSLLRERAVRKDLEECLGLCGSPDKDCVDHLTSDSSFGSV